MGFHQVASDIVAGAHYEPGVIAHRAQKALPGFASSTNCDLHLPLWGETLEETMSAAPHLCPTCRGAGQVCQNELSECKLCEGTGHFDGETCFFCDGTGAMPDVSCAPCCACGER